MNQSSSFINMMNILNVIPHGQEKALRQAFYNAVALFILFMCSAVGYALFYILEPFAKPLIWALLIGSVLHPFKHYLSNHFQLWLEKIKVSPTPLCLELCMLPLHMLDDISEFIGNILNKHKGAFILIGLGMTVIFLVYFLTPCITFFGYAWIINSYFLSFIVDNLSAYFLVPMLILYFTILIFYWNEGNKQLLSSLSYVPWFFISLFVDRKFYILKVPLFSLILFGLSVGYGLEVYNMFTISYKKSSYWKIWNNFFGINKISEDDELNKASVFKNKQSLNDNSGEANTALSSEKLNKNMNEENLHKLFIGEVKKKNLNRDPSVPLRNTQKLDSFSDINDTFDGVGESINCENSSKYIYGVLWACGVMVVWKNLWIVHFIPIPIIIYIIKHLGFYFGIWRVIFSKWTDIKGRLLSWIETRKLAIFPPPVEAFYKYTCHMRIITITRMYYSINSCASILVICGLILFAIFSTFFLLCQIYAEGIHIMSVGNGILNFTLVDNSEFYQLLPESWGNKMEAVINDAYVYGREGISKQVKHLLRGVDNVKAEEFEKHILELWDRIYQAWLVGYIESNSSIGPKVTTNAVFSSWDNFTTMFFKMPDLFNVMVLTDFARENIGTIMSLLESIWSLLKGNISLIFQFLFETLYLILGGGTVVLNFFISTFVFFTALFYLLSSSGPVYKPVELLSNFSPINGSQLGSAFENAVNGVFKATFKMALFYGLWTWLIHNIFQVHIVYVPSVLAAVLGAIPFLGTYWACIPGLLDLWLVQQKGMQAIMLFIFQCLPISFVDTAIYREIKEGHPYLTGLAIAGGVFCMGIQGAIFGPVLLCFFLVALSIYSNLIKESPNRNTKLSLDVTTTRDLNGSDEKKDIADT